MHQTLETLETIEAEMRAALFQHARLPMMNSVYHSVHSEPAPLPATLFYHLFGCEAEGERQSRCETCLERLLIFLGEDRKNRDVVGPVYASNIRVVIYNDGSEERVLIKWPPNSRSQKHDHGNSHGVTYVIEGTVYEMRDGKTICYRTGDKFTEEPSAIHIVGSKTGGLTLHIYRPPITGTMKTYCL